MLANEFAGIISGKFSEILKQKETVNIAISGGSTPGDLFKTLGSEYKEKISWNNINFYWVDERCVPPGSPDSNFGNAYNFLFWKIKLSPSNIYRIKGEDNPAEEAERYSFLVKSNLPNINNLPAFDIILLGVGEDGHTASIFPGQLDIFRSENLYEVTVSPYTGQNRITMTGKVLNNADNVYFLVSGKNKAKVVGEILNGSENSKRYAASHVNPVRGVLEWYLDKDAAENI